MVRLPAMPDERHHGRVVAPDRQRRPALAVGRRDGRGVIVEAAQQIFGIALDVGRVGGTPVRARVHVTQQMERIAGPRGVARARPDSGTQSRAAVRARRRSCRAESPAAPRARAGCIESGGRRRPARSAAAAPGYSSARTVCTFAATTSITRCRGHRAAEPAHRDAKRREIRCRDAAALRAALSPRPT